MIATDRRAVVLATETAEVLLANTPANRLGLTADRLRAMLDWPSICARARRAGSAIVSLDVDDLALEGELVQLPLGRSAGYLLRLSETDQEATWLRNRARASTLMRVSHDLRTPIQSLLASAEALLDPERRDDVDLGQLRRAADLALDHVSNVLAVIRGEQAVGGLQPDETFSLAEELDGLLEIMRPIARARDAKLRSTIHADGDSQVTGPVRFVRALFQNMIDNSVKYGGPAIDIELTTSLLPPTLDVQRGETQKLSVVLEVRDLGGGLPEAQKQRLRQALGHAGANGQTGERTRPAGGLNVLAHALMQLGGRLDVLDRGEMDSPTQKPGETVTGTILRAAFSLDLAKAQTPLDPSSGATDGPDARTDLAGRLILLVEDSPSSRDWLTHVLRETGAQVQPAKSGAEALALLARARPGAMFDLIMTDVTLPNMSGIELARRVREAAQTGKLAWQGRIVGLTAHVDEKIRRACLEAGMLRILEKPIRPAKLCAVLQDVLSAQPVAEAPTAPAPTRAENLARLSSLLEQSVVGDLMSELGRDGAGSFLNRALAEAEGAARTLRSSGIGDDTSRMLHAATGACGLTGLSQLEKCLRQLEVAVERDKGRLPELLDQTDRTVTQTAEAIRALLS
ncbi:response regulator [Oceaniglobus trochenteri]|uniref:response regulator n=1 Tax=Oceaniglobus trochenteri TaxID=2763260 RepID=UPI001CFFC1BE|nr:hybrid sensor histidine kinase/response regulator [Oceaniglobus trochenteri]